MQPRPILDSSSASQSAMAALYFRTLGPLVRRWYPDDVERDPVIEEYKKHIDRTLLRQNLKLTVEQRLRNLMELQKLSEELHRAGRKAR